MNSDCARIQQELLTNESKIVSTAVTVHLEHCSNCSASAATQAQMKSLLQKAIAHDEAAPAALRARIRLELHKPQTFWQHVSAWFESANKGWMMAAVAASVLVVVGSVSWQLRQRAAGKIELASTLNVVGESANNTRLLKIGFTHHKECAVERDYSAGPRTFEQMAQAIGNDWIDLVPLVKKQIPADYNVMIAHRCVVEGRQFIHLILSNQQTLLSLTLTPKNGEAFDAQNVVTQINGETLHQLSVQNYSMVGFETKDYLGYVVSGLTSEQNMQIVARLVPSVSAFVARRES